MGIYAIINIANGKLYVGSSVNIKNRLYNHRYGLRTNTHPNNYLQNAFNKHGESSFKVKILEYVSDKKILLDREQYFMDKYKAYEHDYGYNISTTATPGGAPGRKKTEEEILEMTKKRMTKMGKKSGQYKIQAPDARYYSLPHGDRRISQEKKDRAVKILLDEYQDYCSIYWNDPLVIQFLDSIADYLCCSHSEKINKQCGILSRQSELEITSGSEEYINFADLTYDYQIYFDLVDIEVDENGEEIIQLHELRYLEGIPVYD